MFLDSVEEEFKAEDGLFLSTPYAVGDVDAISCDEYGLICIAVCLLRSCLLGLLIYDVLWIIGFTSTTQYLIADTFIFMTNI